jgi:8-oxo-dGTP pyrophosphatase MutT (NUDIX family)
MSDSSNNTCPHVFFNLLEHFSQGLSNNPKPILHPDDSIEKIAADRTSPLRKASVLIPITRHLPDKESSIILTVRSENLHNHAGQVSLPGGEQEAEDINATATALRESEEEIGLPREKVEVIGQLGKIALSSGFQITPVVGIIEPGLDFTPCPIEVSEIFQAPLSLIMDPKAYKSYSMTYNSQRREMLELQFGEFRIWGATAAILYHLARLVSAPNTHTNWLQD